MAGSRRHGVLTPILVALGVFLVTLAAVWAAPRLSEAVASWVRTPPVTARTIALPGRLLVKKVPAQETSRAARGDAAPIGAGEVRATATGAAGPVLDAGLTFTMLGLTCRPPASDDDVVVLLRTSADGSSWSDWQAAELQRGGEDDRASGLAYTEPLWMGAGRYVQVAACGAGAGDGVAELAGVRLVALDTSGERGGAGAVVGVVRRLVATVARVGLAPPAAAMTSSPDIVRRSEWGADESLRSGSPSYAPVRMAFVHHTVNGNDYTRAQAPGIVRGVYYYHTKALGWSDIGYNFLVDRYGTVYEGRYGGIARGVIGAQTLGFNSGSTGISVMGNFTSATPPRAAVHALERLLAWKLDVHHVDPQGEAKLTCALGQKFATGQVVTFPVIAGHRQANHTSCPGSRLYAQLPTVRKVAAGVGLPKVYGFVPTNAYISPNGDAVRDRTVVAFSVSEAADWEVTVKDAAAATVRSYRGSGTGATVAWDGTDGAGRVLPDGTYTLTVKADSANGKARPATATVTIDTVAPELRGAVVSNPTFSPNGDGYKDGTSLRFTAAETCSARVRLRDAAGQVVRKLTGWFDAGTSARAVRWDGMVANGDALRDGGEASYAFALTLRDLAGNRSVATRSVRIDRTLGFLTATPGVLSPNGDGYRDGSVLGFKLTRPARVGVIISQGGDALRTLAPRDLGTGKGAITWGGKLDNGSNATSGVYRCVVTAESELGVVSAAEDLTVDCFSPRLSASATASVRLGRGASVEYSVRDPYSPTVHVWAVVTGPTGRRVAKLDQGWVRRGKTLVLTWRPPARRTYTLTFRAEDRGGNREEAPARTVLRVR